MRGASAAALAPRTALRAGPATDYPVVAVLGSGFPLGVEGCLQDYSWCDVIACPHRGWVYARDIVYSYQGSRVPVIHYGAAIGIGGVAFVIGNYWQHHYVGRPWYGQMWQRSQRPTRAAMQARAP